jgi:hypothetical protein
MTAYVLGETIDYENMSDEELSEMAQSIHVNTTYLDEPPTIDCDLWDCTELDDILSTKMDSLSEGSPRLKIKDIPQAKITFRATKKAITNDKTLQATAKATPEKLLPAKPESSKRDVVHSIIELISRLF